MPTHGPPSTDKAARSPLLSIQPASAEQTLASLNELLELVTRENPFQRERLGDVQLAALDDLRELPVTTKGELLDDQAAHPPFGSNLTFALERYTHLHHTSGTTGRTLRVLNTAEDWMWWRRNFSVVCEAAGVGPSDRVGLAHSFGPYVLYWASYEGVQDRGAMVIPLGGMDSEQRLMTMREYGATTLLCTPTYAVHLAHVARRKGLEGALAPVERILCAGEPGASIPATRHLIESAWGARCFDHAGLSEVGAFTYPCAEAGGLHLRDDAFIIELLDPGSCEPVADGAPGELVATALHRTGFPVIRYRTGDVAERHPDPCPAGHPGGWLPRGILGRTDDMVVVRGMNVFPSAIEQTLHESEGVGEFRITFYNDPAAMDEVKVEVELARPLDARDIQARMRQTLGLRVRIVPVKPGILKTQTVKARRVVDLRTEQHAHLSHGDGATP